MNKGLRVLAAFLVIFSVFALTACEGEEKLIVGTWKQTASNANNKYGGDVYVFNADGTYSYTHKFATFDMNETGKYRLDKENRDIWFTPDGGWHDDMFGDQEYVRTYVVTSDYLELGSYNDKEQYTRQK